MSVQWERFVQGLFTNPSWCPCDPTNLESIKSYLADGKPILIKAIRNHIFPEWPSTRMASCCRRHLHSELSIDPVYFLVSFWFAHSHTSLISEWIEIDQNTELLPPIHSETYAILLKQWTQREASDSDALWLLHVVSRLREEHLSWKPLCWKSSWTEGHQRVCRKARDMLDVDALEIHPLLIPHVQSCLDRMMK